MNRETMDCTCLCRWSHDLQAPQATTVARPDRDLLRQCRGRVVLREVHEGTHPRQVMARHHIITSLKKETLTRIQEYYDRPRRHSTLGYLTPAEYELGYKDIHELAV